MINKYIRPKFLNKLYNFCNFFNTTAKKKNILISFIYIIKNHNLLKITILFFSTVIISISLKKNLFFKKQFTFFQTTLILFKIFNLNLLVCNKKLFDLSKKFYSFKNNIFNFNERIYYRFLYLTILLTLNKLNVKLYNYCLLRIFKSLKKSQHSKFFLFLKILLENIISKNKDLFTLIKGIKIIISGRIKGKPRSSNIKIINGKVGALSFKSKIKYSTLGTYNKYGTFGLKLWVNY